MPPTTIDRPEELRARMVEEQIASRGVRDARVLDAMRRVPRERFLEEGLEEFAYQDTPLPIESDQTISQPYIVAYMTEALGLRGGERVLEIGTGSGYAAAVLAEIADEVYTVERYPNLAEGARERLRRLGYERVRVRHGDGTRGWPEHAPYDAIVVAAGGPEVPRSLREQLAVGGRLVIPVGPTQQLQKLVRITRTGEDEYRTEDLLEVRFVPLVGGEGWEEGVERPARPVAPGAPPAAGPTEADRGLPAAVAARAEPFDDVETARLDRLLDRIGDARVVLLGEATHGTHEFRALVDWLRKHNRGVVPGRRAGFYGLDLYSLHTSIAAVLAYLDDVDPATAAVARHRYGCLTPYESDPSIYGYAALTDRYRSCEAEVIRMLRDLLDRRLQYTPRDGERYLDAVQNAQLVANAERYYRVMYYGGPDSWNLRDTHMFETLERVLAARGPEARAVVWAHNSHLGDASATEMGARGELNVGQLCRRRFGDGCYAVGFGTDHGTVAAASDWGSPVEVKRIRPSHVESYERVCHEAGVPRFLLPLRDPDLGADLRRRLMEPRLERAIGVIYRPESELASHYFRARLPRQFDEWIWFDETRAVRPLVTEEVAGLPDTYPFGL